MSVLFTVLALVKNRLLKPRLPAYIKELQQRLYASIKMGIFDKSDYIVNIGIIEQVCQCTTRFRRQYTCSKGFHSNK